MGRTNKTECDIEEIVDEANRAVQRAEAETRKAKAKVLEAQAKAMKAKAVREVALKAACAAKEAEAAQAAAIAAAKKAGLPSVNTEEVELEAELQAIAEEAKAKHGEDTTRKKSRMDKPTMIRLILTIVAAATWSAAMFMSC